MTLKEIKGTKKTGIFYSLLKKANSKVLIMLFNTFYNRKDGNFQILIRYSSSHKQYKGLCNLPTFLRANHTFLALMYNIADSFYGNCAHCKLIMFS